MMSGVFEARYPDRCADPDCPSPRIVEGEAVQYRTIDRTTRLAHATCPKPPPPPAICPGCFMALPLTGVCDDCG